MKAGAHELSDCEINHQGLGTTQVRRQLLSLTPRFIAVHARPYRLGNRNGLFAVRRKTVKTVGAAALVAATAMNRGVNEKPRSRPHCLVTWR